MSGWDQWVSFAHGTAANSYSLKSGTESSPATWYISIGDQEKGDTWDKTPGFPCEFSAADVIMMGKAISADNKDIFTCPPKGYTFMNTVECDAVMVLAGKGKGIAGRQVFAAWSTTTILIAVVDLTNSNKGCEISALDAFGEAVQSCIGHEI